MLNKKVFFNFFLLLFITFKGLCQPDGDSSRTELQSVTEYRQQADELYNAFKNGPAFEYLQKYGELKEKELNRQRTDELQHLESKFKIDFSRRQQELRDILKSIDSLKKENESLEIEKQKLSRNTILFFFLLISFLGGILIRRMQLSKKVQLLADISSVQLSRTLKLAEVPEYFSKTSSDVKFGFNSIFELSSKSIPSISKLKSTSVNQKKDNNDFIKLEESMSHIHNYSEKAFSSVQAIEQSLEEITEERTITNLNNLIDEVCDLSFHWIKSFDESFECNVVKDLEKILPQINIMPVAIRTALFHFFNNAFYSVYERKKTAGKNYEAKVSVTSRKLPRFVQVRIKDNGWGIDDKNLSKIYNPFYTSKSPEAANGLGLTIASEIIKRKHGGEIIIESEPGNGADFIIRFPINNPM